MKKLTEADRSWLMDYLMKEAAFNVFIIGDVENHGFEDPNVEVFASCNGEDVDCVLLRYYEDVVVYSQNADYDPRPVAEYIQKLGKACINGKKSVMEKLAPFFPHMDHTLSYLSKLSEVKEQSQPVSFEIRRLKPRQGEKIVELYLSDADFGATSVGREKEAAERFSTQLSGEGMRVYGVFEGEKLVCSATATARNSLSAMIIGVITHESARGKGYASAVVAKLCADLLAEGLEFLCLFYHNPAAGRIYHRIGFIEIGEYMIIDEPTPA